MKHVFPAVPINSGCFAPIHVKEPRGTFLYAEYPRPVAGCAAETSQRIMETMFGALGQAIPDRLFAGPAGTSGNFALGGRDPERQGDSAGSFVMYVFSGGGYGDPKERPRELVQCNLRCGYFSEAAAESGYGYLP